MTMHNNKLLSAYIKSINNTPLTFIININIQHKYWEANNLDL